jgi:ferredoxin-NADP reductase
MISIRLEDHAVNRFPAAPPGQYVTLRIRPDGDGRSVLRNYSPAGPPGAAHYRFTVKREPTASLRPDSRYRRSPADSTSSTAATVPDPCTSNAANVLACNMSAPP